MLAIVSSLGLEWLVRALQPVDAPAGDEGRLEQVYLETTSTLLNECLVPVSVSAAVVGVSPATLSRHAGEEQSSGRQRRFGLHSVHIIGIFQQCMLELANIAHNTTSMQPCRCSQTRSGWLV